MISEPLGVILDLLDSDAEISESLYHWRQKTLCTAHSQVQDNQIGRIALVKALIWTQ